MIEIRRGDILQADAEALVNTVNCVGVMGRGIALQFRKAYPENFKEYKALCDRGEFSVGKVHVHERGSWLNPAFIINFPTKRHWRSNSRTEDIKKGMQSLIQTVRQLGISSIAIPPLGCGLGGLQWEEVRPLIEEAFQDLPDVQVLLFEPGHSPSPDAMVKEKTAPLMTMSRAILLNLMQKYLSAVMTPSVTLLEVHKLMYFMQEAGCDLQLRIKKGPYGPYAENLRHVLTRIEGYFVQGYGDTHDKPDKAIHPLPEPSTRAGEFLAQYPIIQERLDRVSDLIYGFETPYGMELLSTVHWVVHHEDAKTQDEALAMTYAWNTRKRMLRENHIRIAWDSITKASQSH